MTVAEVHANRGAMDGSMRRWRVQKKKFLLVSISLSLSLSLSLFLRLTPGGLNPGGGECNGTAYIYSIYSYLELTFFHLMPLE